MSLEENPNRINHSVSENDTYQEILKFERRGLKISIDIDDNDSSRKVIDMNENTQNDYYRDDSDFADYPDEDINSNIVYKKSDSDRNNDDIQSELSDEKEKLFFSSEAFFQKSKVSDNTFPPSNDFDGVFKRLIKPIDDYQVIESTHYVWNITDWKALTNSKAESPLFRCGGFDWSIILYIRSSNNNDSISIYVKPNHISASNDDWYVCAQFGLDVWNPDHPNCHIYNSSHHRFNKNETDWGFSSFSTLSQLTSYNKMNENDKPILENNKLNITAYIKIIDDSPTKVLWSSFVDYDSKKSTGYVGLNNQGATCYLNSLLQSYYFTKCFKKLVYEIPVTIQQDDNNCDENTKKKNVSNNHDNLSDNVFSDGYNGNVFLLELQKIFYLLLTSDVPVGTMNLTKSFGWDFSDAFTQHDIQELNRILMDKLEIAMKKSNQEKKLHDMFVGKMKSYIKCINVPYESSMIEDFWDIQLNVKGFNSLQDSFKNYIEIEMLDGENMYQAGNEYGYQVAKKGVVFRSFPNVLHLQLKRFEYNFMVDELVKIDDFYKFSDSLDLKDYLDEDLDDDIKNQNWTYKLHGILVHQGSISNGHYYAMIKPDADIDLWLRFDDDKVWKVTTKQVFDENFGSDKVNSDNFLKMSRSEQQKNLLRRLTSAYMLVYYRESELHNILPKDDDFINLSIPDYIPKLIKKENEMYNELEKKKKEEFLFLNAKFITVSHFVNHNGFDLTLDPINLKCFDLNSFNKNTYTINLKFKKDEFFSTLIQKIGFKLEYFNNDNTFKTKNNFFRLLVMSHRNNNTNRSVNPISSSALDLTIESIQNKFFNVKYDEFMFYVEELNKEMKNANILNSTQKVDDPLDFDYKSILNKFENISTSFDNNLLFYDTSNDSNYILIFIKFFDLMSQKIYGLTHIIVQKSDKVKTITNEIKSFLGFSKDVELEFFEELSPFRIEPININATFEKQELNNGDIITSQVVYSDINKKKIKFKSAIDYYKFLLTRIRVVVRKYKNDESIIDKNKDKIGHENHEDSKTILNKSIEKTFEIWVSNDMNYDELVTEIASNLGENIDKQYLLIYFVSVIEEQSTPLNPDIKLSNLLQKMGSVNNNIFFEYKILDMKLEEYVKLKNVKTYWLSNLLQYQTFELFVPKNGVVYDLMDKLFEKVKVPDHLKKYLLVWCGNNNLYFDLINFDMSIDSIPDGKTLYVGIFPIEVEILSEHEIIKKYEDVPIDLDFCKNNQIMDEYLIAKKMKKNLNLISVFHFHKNVNHRHGIPFILIVYPTEKFEVTKERLRKKLGLGTQAFEKIKFVLIDNKDRVSYIDPKNDELILFEEIGRSQISLSFALDHPDRNIRRQNYDKGISIK